MAIRWDSHRRQALIENVKFLHESGVPPHKWPARVGRTPVALEGALRKEGELHLANMLAFERKTGHAQ